MMLWSRNFHLDGMVGALGFVVERAERSALPLFTFGTRGIILPVHHKFSL